MPRTVDPAFELQIIKSYTACTRARQCCKHITGVCSPLRMTSGARHSSFHFAEWLGVLSEIARHEVSHLGCACELLPGVSLCGPGAMSLGWWSLVSWPCSFWWISPSEDKPFSFNGSPGNLGMVVHPYNPSVWEAEVGGCRIQGQSWLRSDILSQRKHKQNQNCCSQFCQVWLST